MLISAPKLYIIAKEGSIWSCEFATLAAINRALVTSPEPLSNIEFAFNTDDRIEPVALWGYARQATDELSWPEIKAGSTKEVLMKIEQDEQNSVTQWASKSAKLFWRGVVRMGPEIRDKLLSVTAGKEWADVKELGWGDDESMKNDYKIMPQHCGYKFIAQTEGNSYSGRLKYLQMCRSVVVSHTLDWIQHTYHLMRRDGPEQNFVEIQRDWEDLEEKIS
ncbi:CAZyme family GT90 [Penicillium vulpinum]|uniref:CAZyme family GT90 n=1 Tax=Penicillium vulpinum TaxID=29845 RepID=UPI0025486D0A|nr:CAZyme family GT90 [Penicillium vulpinum]KAJ5951282.1 CAZyme family GT90 [Penicillium vulpinum]